MLRIAWELPERAQVRGTEIVVQNGVWRHFSPDGDQLLEIPLAALDPRRTDANLRLRVWAESVWYQANPQVINYRSDMQHLRRYAVTDSRGEDVPGASDGQYTTAVLSQPSRSLTVDLGSPATLRVVLLHGLLVYPFEGSKLVYSTSDDGETFRFWAESPVGDWLWLADEISDSSISGPDRYLDSEHPRHGRFVKVEVQGNPESAILAVREIHVGGYALPNPEQTTHIQNNMNY
jgi:hypothetical protein